MVYDVVGIGNMLMDILVEVDESVILEFGLQKGMFTLIDDAKAKEILSK